MEGVFSEKRFMSGLIQEDTWRQPTEKSNHRRSQTHSTSAVSEFKNIPDSSIRLYGDGGTEEKREENK